MIQRVSKEDMARMNRSAAARLARREGGLSRAELARRLSLTPAALTDIASDLLAWGILREGVERRRGMGRPATRLELAPDWAHVVTVSLTRSLAVGIVNLAGELVWAETVQDVPWGRRPRNVSFEKQVPGVVARALERAPGRVLGIGVISGGRVSRDGVISHNYNLSRRNVDLREALAPVTGLPVNVDEEFRLLLLSQITRDEALAAQSVVAMSGAIAGYGGGQALCFNGQLYYGARGYAGNSNLPLLHGEEEVRRMHHAMEAMGGEEAYLKAVGQGRPEAMDIYRKAVDNYGYRLAQIAHNFNPDLALIYSPYVFLGGAFLDDMMRVARRHTDPYNLEGLRVRFGGERNDRERLAAAAVPVIERFLAAGDFAPRTPRAAGTPRKRRRVVV
ncbi:MAG TPA: ROK family protein [Candidatus Brocadiia bacterium]|nr:ROK family protein [Candidatus Brocadiia bacterium]